MAIFAEKGTLIDNKPRGGGSQGKKKALIIAISHYDNLPPEKQLPFCKNDGEEIYQVLQKQGYEIPDDWKLMGRVTSKQLRDAIFDFFRKRADSRDTLLFYFSGHGVPDGYGAHYLAPSDIKTDIPDYHGIRFSELEDQANRSAAKKIIRILDCCFSGAAGITMGTEEDIAKSARSAMDRTFKEGDGKCVLASSLADQVSYKKRGESYSLFTYCLLEGLRGGNGEAVNREGYVTPSTLGNYVYHRIMEEDRRQKPITKTEMVGDIILAYYPELGEKQVKEVSPSSSTPAFTTKGNNNAVQMDNYLNFLLDSARQYYTDRNYANAVVFFNKVLEMKPEHIEALNSKGISLYRLGEYDEAKRCFERVLEIDPENIFAPTNIEILGKKKDAEEPSRYVQDPKQSYSNDASAWYSKGEALYHQGKYNEAIQHFGKAVEIKPDYLDAWNNKGLAYSNLGKYEEAVLCYNNALKINPNFVDTWNNKGLALRRLDMYDQAIECYNKAIEKDPNFADAWYNKGLVYSNSRKYKQAIECHKKALEINPNFADAWYNKGLVYSNSRNYNQAYYCYNKALEINPNFVDAWYSKGKALEESRLPEQALRCYDKAIEKDPNFAQAWYDKGVILHNSRKYEEAIKSFDKAIEKDPNLADAWYSKGLALRKLGNKKYAKECEMKAKELGYKG